MQAEVKIVVIHISSKFTKGPTLLWLSLNRNIVWSICVIWWEICVYVTSYCMLQMKLTLLINIWFSDGWHGTWQWGWRSRGKVVLIAILETSCLGCLYPFHSSSMAVPLIVGLCLTLQKEDTWEIYMKLIYVECEFNISLTFSFIHFSLLTSILS